MAMFVAQRHLVDYDNCDKDDMLKTVQKFIPRKMLGNGGIAMTSWTDKIYESYKEQGFSRAREMFPNWREYFAFNLHFNVNENKRNHETRDGII